MRRNLGKNRLQKSSLMAERRPVRLDDYCRASGQSFFELQLDCIFCKRRVSLTDLAAVFEKNLSLVYRNDRPHAACSECLCNIAKLERERYTECICDARLLVPLVRKPLDDCVIRCYMCLKRLDSIDKNDLITYNWKVCCIRGQWRSACRLCRK